MTASPLSAQTEPQPYIRLAGVRREFADGTGLHATDLSIGRGEFVSVLALVVNNNAVDEAPPDWEDLTDEKYKDQIIMPDPRESSTAAALITAMATEKGKDATWELFEKLFDNGMIIQGANGEALNDIKQLDDDW